jgi:hypothetical protein
MAERVTAGDRLSFILLNTLMVSSVLAVAFGAVPEYLAYHGVALGIIALQSVVFFRFSRWAPRLVVLYLGFALFCWTLTLSDVWSKREQLASVGGVAGLVLRGVAFVVFAHLAGYVLLVPVMTMVNQVVFRARKRPR